MVFSQDNKPLSISKTHNTHKHTPSTTIHTLEDENITDHSNRVPFENEHIMGSINLQGLRIDDLQFKKYYTTIDQKNNVTLLSQSKAYFSEFGWISKQGFKLPDTQSVWKANNESLVPGETLMLSWDNGGGIIFHIDITIDDRYMFAASQYIENNTENNVQIMNYGKISRRVPAILSNFIFHEGITGLFSRKLTEISYKKIFKKGYNLALSNASQESNRWFSVEEKYWFSSMIMSQPYYNITLKALDKDRIQIYFIGEEVSIAKNRIGPYQKTHFFAGVKELDVLDEYKTEYGIPMFDKNLDFGFFYFVTKPMFLFLNFINSLTGNFGISIIIFIFLVKLALFPITQRSSIAMMKIQKLQPEIKKIREKYKNNQVQMNQEIINIFSSNKVNPASGIFPILLQIPLFFSLYKVLMITIQMRQAPFFFWINDLSEPDPSNILTLFDMITWSPPVSIGILPVILGMSMFLQQKFSKNSSFANNLENAQGAQIIKMMPILFVFVSSHFPSGLLLYWICSNIISILQQLYIKNVVFKKHA